MSKFDKIMELKYIYLKLRGKYAAWLWCKKLLVF